MVTAYVEVLADQVDSECPKYVETLRERADHAVALPRAAEPRRRDIPR